MADFLSDQEIEALLQEEKELPEDYERQMTLRAKRGHAEFEITLTGENGSNFRIIARRSNFNHLDFSVILAYCVPGTHRVLRLRRYNGKSHEHTNPIEKETFYDFHIHTATERYQKSGNREDTFAEATTRYADFRGAVGCMIEDCALVVPPGTQTLLPLLTGGDL